MSGARRGRPPNPVDPGASHAARLGAEIRAWRLARDLTLQQLGDLAGYTPQYVSEIERAKALPTRPFVAACDAALEADGALLALLPAVIQERTEERQERAAARRAARDGAPLPCEAHSDAGEDVDPTNRRGLIGAAGTAALGLSTAAAPAAAREIDPGLPDHWDALLDLLGCHDAAFGPHRVLEAVRNELRVIAEHRQVARGELRTQLMRAEARWASFAAWLSHDAGDLRRRDAWTDRAAWLALEAGYPDMQAFTRSRQSRFAAQAHDAPRTGAFAEAGLRVKGTSAQTRALCSAWSALGHALAGDAMACERSLTNAYALVENAGAASPPWVSGTAAASCHVRATEAHCWSLLEPRKAIPLYDGVLRDWPRNRVRDGAVHRARLALACAAAGEPDRARVEGRKALAIMRSTRSNLAAVELHRLRQALAAA